MDTKEGGADRRGNMSTIEGGTDRRRRQSMKALEDGNEEMKARMIEMTVAGEKMKDGLQAMERDLAKWQAKEGEKHTKAVAIQSWSRTYINSCTVATTYSRRRSDLS